MDESASIADFLFKKTIITPHFYLQKIPHPKVDTAFTSGFFTVGETGKVSFEFLYNGGGYQGELAIFSLTRLEDYEVGSHKFLLEVVTRALSNSKLGRIVITDRTPGKSFNRNLGNLTTLGSEDCSLTDTFMMNPGDTLGMMLIPQGTLEQVFNRLKITEGALPKRLNPLFSFATANFKPSLSLGEIVDVGGKEVTFVLENLVPQESSQKDCNDIVFRVKGAKGKAINLDEEQKPSVDLSWQKHKSLEDLVQKYLNLPTESETGVNYQPGELLVKFDSSFKEAQIHHLAATYGAKQVNSLLPWDIESDSPLRQWHLMVFSRHVNLLFIRDRLEKETGVEATELNIVSFSTKKKIMSQENHCVK